MTQPPEVLVYQSPVQPVSSPLRQKAAKHAYGNGWACTIIGLLAMTFVAMAFTSPRGAPALMHSPLGWLLIGYAVLFATCGILYIIGGYKIKRGSLAWHRNVIVAAAIHLVAMVGWLGLLVWATSATAGRSGSGPGSGPNPVPFLVVTAIMIALGKMIQHVRSSRAELQPRQ